MSENDEADPAESGDADETAQDTDVQEDDAAESETAEEDATEEELDDGDFVRLSYTIWTVEDDSLVDTTDEELAEEEGIDTEGRDFAPQTVVLGGGHLFPGVEDDITGKRVGDSGSVLARSIGWLAVSVFPRRHERLPVTCTAAVSIAGSSRVAPSKPSLVQPCTRPAGFTRTRGSLTRSSR